MSAQLVMAGTGQPVIHDQSHNLESIFYVLVGICVLFDRPNKPKCNKDLAQCFDKYINTFEPSVLKTITIQSDLTWKPFILHHISLYFQPIIPLLTRLQKDIILPLSTDDNDNVHRKVDFTHDMFINAIIETLLYLGPGAWIPVDQEGDNGDDSKPHVDHYETKSNSADLASEVNFPPADAPHESLESISSSYLLNISTLPPMLPRPAPYQPSAGLGFYSVDSGLACHRSTCYERTEVHCVGCTSLPVSERTEGNSLRFAKRIALANELERSSESTWDLTSHNTRVVAK